MLLTQYGQSRVVGSAGSSVLRRDISQLTGLTTKKKMTAARITNATSTVKNEPTLIWLLLMVQIVLIERRFAAQGAENRHDDVAYEGCDD